jgi:hypothetical protein
MFILLLMLSLPVKLVLHPVLRGTMSGLRAKMRLVRRTQVESTFFVGRKQDAEHAA